MKGVKGGEGEKISNNRASGSAEEVSMKKSEESGRAPQGQSAENIESRGFIQL